MRFLKERKGEKKKKCEFGQKIDMVLIGTETKVGIYIYIIDLKIKMYFRVRVYFLVNKYLRRD